jgi:hypothetical protein
VPAEVQCQQAELSTVRTVHTLSAVTKQGICIFPQLILKGKTQTLKWDKYRQNRTTLISIFDKNIRIKPMQIVNQKNR